MNAIGASYFAKKPEQMSDMLDELYAERLIESDRGYAPSLLSPGDAITVTPRARKIWEELATNDTLLGCFRDDLHLSERHNWTRIPTHQLDIRQRCREVLALCQDAVEGEAAELLRLKNDDILDDFRIEFGNEWISDRLLNGFSAGIYSFYTRYIQDWSYFGMEDELLSLSRRLAEVRGGLNQDDNV
ncbi:MAG: hypothetical protein WC735_01380 [Candidatus Paceibacterota bacterium]